MKAGFKITPTPPFKKKKKSRLFQTTLELLRSEHPEDLKAVETHLNRIRTSCIEEVRDVFHFLFMTTFFGFSYKICKYLFILSTSKKNIEICHSCRIFILSWIINGYAHVATQTNSPVIEAPEANFMKLVQGLIEDTDGREHFLKVKIPFRFVCFLLYSCIFFFNLGSLTNFLTEVIIT